jgi:Helix-turn-helix domain
MTQIENLVAREAKAMTRQEVIQKAMAGRISWIQAADICRVTERHMRRLRDRYERFSVGGLRDGRAGKQQPSTIDGAVVEELCRLKREIYQEFNIRHFHQFATEKHGLKVSYTTTKNILQARGLAEKAPARGKYRRKRERRPMVGMLLHLDASTHEWIAGLPMWDLNVMMDDADGRILYARFVPQEGTASTMAALHHVLTRWGRFCEFYTDRGSHFCRTTKAEEGPDKFQAGQVARVLKALGTHHILARSPQARGRSERLFETVQGRLPAELKVAGVRDYGQANEYLEKTFVPDFNRHFTVKPTEAGSAFVPIAGIDLRLLLSIQHERVVRNDSTVMFSPLVLQIPKTRDRLHYVRCPVVVHEFTDGTLGVSHQGKLLARYTGTGELLVRVSKKKAA